MQEETNLLIQEYAKHPLCNTGMEAPTTFSHEGNFICGDDITVYLKIENSIVVEYSYTGNCSTITTAAASFLSEFIVGESVDTILTWNYETMLSKGFEVSTRRRRAAVIAILAARNGIHTYLSDGKEDSFDDLLD
ncbi:MAG: iron-sulfur cluster assembly scaffold protein [Candidatus Absconditabacteria bacterium]